MNTEDSTTLKVLQISTKFLAIALGAALVIASSIEIYKVSIELLDFQISSAIQEGMFMLILLEMFYVVRSFIKYGSVNTSLIISVGIVAIIKVIIFNLNTMDLNKAIGFSVLFLSLSVGLLLENQHYKLKIDQGRKPVGLNIFKDFFMTNEEQIQELEQEDFQSAQKKEAQSLS